MARRLRSSLATLLAVSIVVLSPGLEAPRLFAQVVGRGVPVEGVRAVPGLPGAAPALTLPGSALSAPSLTAPSLTAPSAFAAPAAAVPAAAPALAAAPARAASIPAMAKALAPHLEAAAKPETSAAGAATAGREIEDVLTGARSSGAGDLAATLGAESAGAPALGSYSAASAPAETKPSVPGAPAPAEGKVVASRASYQLHRFLLKSVAALTGALYSLPIAGPALSQKLIASAADRRVVLSDYDDTLAGYNQVLPEDMVEAVRAVRAAGKDFAVISDRGDEKRAHQLTVFESLATLPVELRAGMYVAANSGGRVYRYDASGEPVRVFEVPALADDLKAKVAEAAAATKARLAEAGTEQHQPSETNNNPAESWGTYGYAMMLKVGSSKESVVKAGEILQEELAARGMSVEVSPRFAKDPANPPYINFSIVTKAPAAEFIAKALGAKASDVLAIGDNAYAPRHAKKASWLTRLGARLSGRDVPATGNMTDRNMEKGVPGALTLSVGRTGDPTASNLWVLSGKGPATTREVLMSVASKPRGPSGSAKGDSAEAALHLTAIVAIVAAAAVGYWAMFHAIGDIVRMGEEHIQGLGRDLFEGGALFGGFLAWGPFSKKGDDLKSRYAALEAEHAARLSAVPGVVAVKVEDHDFYYGGTLNDTEGKRLRVVFKDVAAFEAGRGTLPTELPALAGIKDVARYEVVPEVEPKALAAAYAALEAAHSAALAKTPGAVGVRIEDYDFFYGGTLNDSEGKIATVYFDDLSSYHAALASLPKTLPAIDGVRDVKLYQVRAEMTKKALAAEYAKLEAGYAARFSALPGAVGVTVEHSFHPYGGNDDRLSGKDLVVTFDGVASLQAAKASGLLPEELPAIADVADVAKYRVSAEVAPAAPRWRRWAAGAGVVAFAVAAGYLGAHAGGVVASLGTRAVLPDPATGYARALKAAVEAAAARGASAESVRFVEATAAMPVSGGALWHYAFTVPGKDGGNAMVYVDFKTFMGGEADARVSVYDGAPAPKGKLAAPLDAYYFGRGVRLTPETALDAARRAGPALGSRVSVSLDYRAEAVTGDKDLWYRFYDDKGGIVSVNARSGETAVESVAALSLRGLVSKASPIDGFSTYVYQEGLAAVKELAAKAGFDPENLRLTGASLSPRAWGEDWTFRFVSPRQSDFKGPNAWSVKVRRTMVSETQLDAYDAKDEGPRRLFAGVPASLVPEALKVTPMDVVEKSGPEARSLSLEARFPEDGGPARLHYVLRGEKGRELKSVDAGTGVEAVPTPYQRLKDVLIGLGLIAAVAAVYGTLAYAISHAGAAPSAVNLPEGWQGAVPQGGWEMLFGGTLAAGAAKRRGRKPKLAEERVRGAAASVASYKGRPWSQTEYNMAYYTTLESLKKDGATKAQLALFEKLCAEAPIRGGSFNPWSGD
ncbi:MAG: hypothetical protein HY079_01140 [Elusimicrobia bacterium]|nr:hypothetical protein [Elusimicrobiota bacterium]